MLKVLVPVPQGSFAQHEAAPEERRLNHKKKLGKNLSKSRLEMAVEWQQFRRS